MLLGLTSLLLSCLHVQATDSKQLFKAVYSKKSQAVEIALNQGIDPNERDERGWTPLHHASYSGSFDVIRSLINGGADINAQTPLGNTPLHLSVSFFEKRKYTLKKVLKDGRKILSLPFRLTHWNDFGKITTHFSAKKFKRFEIGMEIEINVALKKKFKPITLKNWLGRTQITDMLVDLGADINHKDHSGRTPLHKAISLKRIKFVKTLLKRQASLSARDISGQTPLHLASSLRHLDIIKLLFKFEANPDSQDTYLLTPLHYTAWKGDKIVAASLLQAGASIDAQDDRGQTPLHMVLERDQKDGQGSPEFMVYLLNQGASPYISDNQGQTFLDMLKHAREDFQQAFTQALQL